MCGIAGVAGPGTAEELQRVAERMGEVIRHRGPDDRGAWAGDGVSVAMRRLSIIDLQGGHQPMWTDDGVGIVFNGEIYNHCELRERLRAAGEPFRTRSDTEVLLRQLARHGLAGLREVRGMFAACLIDRRAGRLLLVRDRVGKKPLYHGVLDGRLVFASELKAILAVLDHRPALNRQAVHDYLSLRYVPGPETIWEGLYKLPPGSALRHDLRTGEQQIENWWSVDVVAGACEPGRDYVQEFEDLFTDAVRERLEAADVPVGVMLSGGLDSSAVSAAAVRSGHRAFHTFAVGYKEGDRHSELAHARAVAEHLGARHHELQIGPDAFADGLRDLVWQTDEPLADLATIPLHRLSLVAREHVKVVLSGEGADEVLAGYNFERMAAGLNRLRYLRRAPRALLRLGARGVRGDRAAALRALAVGGWAGYPAAMGTHSSWTMGEQDKARLWRGRAPLRPTEELLASWYADCPSPEPLDRVQQVAMGSWLVEDLLMKADKATMAASLELRCPFLDHRLVEWGTRLPMRWKVGDAEVGWASKRVLRVAAAGWLPAATIDRPKQGFPVPAYDWLAGEGGAWAAARLSVGGPMTELFDPSAMVPELERARAADSRAAQRVWLWLVLQAWMERWL
ncbi:MAG TPA: asparagine synthase (glutamine-hydrolyzing) [Solirubrobacteraceae bacterium]|nr:asparagine synthase (glutamine-hydrolyzing) [Solirubrobacteraceae bacterium]